MTWKKAAAIVGMGLFLAGIGLALFLWIGSGQAALLDEEASAPPITGPVDCTDLVTAETFLSRRVMAEDETQALTVRLSNSSAVACNVTVALSAPRFTITPSNNQQSVLVPPEGPADVTWIVSPHALGVYDLVVTVGGRPTIIGITVTNIMGLTALQAQLLSMLATFLGPLLSAPWWFERWQQWRKKEQREKELLHQKKLTEQKEEAPQQQQEKEG